MSTLEGPQCIVDKPSKESWHHSLLIALLQPNTSLGSSVLSQIPPKFVGRIWRGKQDFPGKKCMENGNFNGEMAQF